MENLETLHDRIRDIARKEDRVSFDDILQVTGRKSFGIILFLTGIITLAPLIGDIPGVPSMMGAIVVIISFQLLFQQDRLWLPAFLRDRDVDRDKVKGVLDKIKPAVRFTDRILKPRLTLMTQGIMVYIIAGICVVTAFFMPLMEFIPFSANIAGIILTAFGLALVTNDGLLVVLAITVIAAAGGAIAYYYL